MKQFILSIIILLFATFASAGPYIDSSGGGGGGEGSGSMTTTKEATVQVGGADIVTIDFGAGFDLTEDPNTEINVSFDLSEISAALNSISGLTEADVSIIEATADNTYGVVTSGGNNYILGSNSGNTALEFKTPANVLSQIGAQASDADLTTWAGVTPGTGVATALAINIGSAGAPVLFNGAGGTPSALNLTNAVVNSGMTLPETCTVGNYFYDTDADTDGELYVCRATNTWKAVDDDGGAGGMATTDIDTSAEISTIVTDEVGTGALAFATSTPFTTSITPNSAGASTIGTTALEWGNVYLTDSAVIYGQADQSNTLTSSATGWTTNLDLTVGGGNINFGNIAGVLGDATTDSVTITTDGTGDAEVVLPTGAIATGEILNATLIDEDMANNALDPDKLVGDETDDDKVDQDIIEGMGASATPGITLADSDAAATGTAFIGVDAYTAGQDSILQFKVDDSTGEKTIYMEIDGVTEAIDMLKPINVPAEAYDATNWDADTGAPQKDAVRDKIEAMPQTAGDHITLTGTDLDVDDDFLLNNGDIGTGVYDFGGATSVEIPNSDDPDTSAEGQISLDTDGWVRVYDNSLQKALSLMYEVQVTVIKPNDLADAQRDAFLVYSNETGMNFVITGWKGWSDVDDTTLNIETTAADGQTNATVDAVELATNGTGVYTGADTSITAGTIANGSLIWLNFDNTDAPGIVHMTIYGYLAGDVN